LFHHSWDTAFIIILLKQVMLPKMVGDGGQEAAK
jgi:hypothetical protein